jgi:hypothetical protein
MKPRTLPVTLRISRLAEEIIHTTSLLRAYPFLAGEVATFDALLVEWLKLLQQENALMGEQSDAEARAIVIDDAVDFLCVAISATLLAESGGNRKSAAYQRYFGTTRPSALKRPVLGQQLETMRTWPPSLTDAASSPALQQYGKQLAERVIEGDAAVAALSEAGRKRADFDLGPRKAFVDRLNAARHVLYGRLAELPHKHPARNLPRDFARRFFLRDERRTTPTIGEVEQSILRLRERLQKQEELLARLVEQEEAEMQLREDAELMAAEEALEAAERQAAEAAERLEALRAQRTRTAV